MHFQLWLSFARRCGDSLSIRSFTSTAVAWWQTPPGSGIILSAGKDIQIKNCTIPLKVFLCYRTVIIIFWKWVVIRENMKKSLRGHFFVFSQIQHWKIQHVTISLSIVVKLWFFKAMRAILSASKEYFSVLLGRVIVLFVPFVDNIHGCQTEGLSGTSDSPFCDNFTACLVLCLWVYACGNARYVVPRHFRYFSRICQAVCLLKERSCGRYTFCAFRHLILYQVDF